MKKPTHAPFAELYERLKPLDKLALILFLDDQEKGIKSVVKTRFADNSLTTLSYAGLAFASQKRDEFPVVEMITPRGVNFARYIKMHTTIEELAAQLPDGIMNKGM